MGPLQKNMTLPALIAGLFTFLILLVMLIAGGNPKPAAYPNADGFSAAIYWFEVTESADDLFRALGDPSLDKGAGIRSTMDRVNRIDFAFMAAYSVYFALLFVMMRGLIAVAGPVKTRITILAAAGVVFSILMLAGDIMENVQLLKLTGYASPEETDMAVIGRLMAFTRLKWFAIFLGSLALAALYIEHFGKRLSSFLFALFYGLTAVIGFISFFVPGMRAMIELSSFMLLLAWLVSLLHVGVIMLRGSVPGGNVRAARNRG